MTTVINCSAVVKLEEGDFCTIMGEMNAAGWTSVWWQSKLSVFRVSGMPDSDILVSWFGYSGGDRDKRTYYNSDVFVKDQQVYYLNLQHGWSEHVFEMELGMVSKGEVLNYDLLRPFVDALRAAIRRCFDGRKAR